MIDSNLSFRPILPFLGSVAKKFCISFHNRREEIALIIDFAPTFLDIAGAKPNKIMDGTSLLDVAMDVDAVIIRDLLQEFSLVGGQCRFPLSWRMVVFLCGDVVGVKLLNSLGELPLVEVLDDLIVTFMQVHVFSFWNVSQFC